MPHSTKIIKAIAMVAAMYATSASTVIAIEPTVANKGVGLAHELPGRVTTGIKSAREIARTTLPSVVMLLMKNMNGEFSSLGSGFIVRPGLVATNAHVVRSSQGGYVKIVGQTSVYRLGSIVATDEQRDLALVSVSDIKVSSLSLGKSSSLAIGDSIYAVGNPEGLEGTFSQGIVSAIRQFNKVTKLQITAPISHGSSGGPVLDSHGLVVGISQSIYREGQNLNFAIPSSYLVSLLSQIQWPPMSSPNERIATSSKRRVSPAVFSESVWKSYYDAATNTANSGHYKESLSLFDSALAEAAPLGDRDNRLALTLNGLANAHFCLFQYDKAKPLYERAMAIAEKGAGPDDSIAVAAYIDNCAENLYRACDYSRSEQLYKKSLALKENAYGLDDVKAGLNGPEQCVAEHRKMAG